MSLLLLSHFDATTGTTTYYTEDVGFRPVTFVGGAQIATAQSKFGGSSLKLGTSNYVTLPHSSDFNIGANTFTFGCWVYLNNIPSGNTYTLFSLYDSSSNNFRIELIDNGGGSTSLSMTSNNGGTASGYGWFLPTVTPSTWHYITISRSISGGSETVNGFYDGTLVNAYTQPIVTYPTLTTTPLYLGTYNGGNYVDGYIDEISLTSTCDYTTTFSVPTTETIGVLTSSLQDNFTGSSVDSTKWNSNPTYSTVSGNILTSSFPVIGSGAGYTSVFSKRNYAFVDSYISCYLGVPYGWNGGNLSTSLFGIGTPNGSLGASVSLVLTSTAGACNTVLQASGMTTQTSSYDASKPYFKMATDSLGTTITFYNSADGITWSSLYSHTWTGGLIAGIVGVYLQVTGPTTGQEYLEVTSFNSSPIVHIFDTTSTWTCPAGVTSVTAKVWGAGTDGTYDSSGGAGGGGGAYTTKVVAVTPTTSYTTTVGASGGASSWFDTTGTVLAVGGSGKTGGAASSCIPTSGAYSGGTGWDDAGLGGGHGGAGGGSAGSSGNGNNASSRYSPGTGGTPDGGNGGDSSDFPGYIPGGGGSGAGSSDSGTPTLGGHGRVILNWSAPQTYYAITTGGNWSDANTWALSTGQSVGGAGVPTNADTVYIDSTLTSGHTVTNDSGSNVGASLNMTGMLGTFDMGTNTLTISGSVTLPSGGTLTGTGTLVINAAGTLTSNGKTWPAAFNFNTTGNVTLSGNWVNNGAVLFNSYSTLDATVSETFTCNSGLTLNSSTGANTATIIMAGGTFNCTGASYLAGSLTIQPSHSNVTINNLNYNAGTISYTPSTYSASATGDVIVEYNGNVILNTNGFSWNNFDFWYSVGSKTITFGQGFVVSGALQFHNGYIYTLAGSHGFTCGSLVITSGAQVTFVSGQTYTVTGTFTANGTSGSPVTLNSSVSSTKAYLPVTTLGTVSWVSATDIDSSGGTTIHDSNGTLLRTINWDTSMPSSSSSSSLSSSSSSSSSSSLSSSSSSSSSSSLSSSSSSSSSSFSSSSSKSSSSSSSKSSSSSSSLSSFSSSSASFSSSSSSFSMSSSSSSSVSYSSSSSSSSYVDPYASDIIKLKNRIEVISFEYDK